MIILLADFFAAETNGGAELTTEALFEDCLQPVLGIKTEDLTGELIQKYKNHTWFITNFGLLRKAHRKTLLLQIIKNIKKYFVIEYDYKFCIHRSRHKHFFIEKRPCDCATTTHGKLVALLHCNASGIFWMSQKQKEEYFKAYPILKEANNIVINSIFSEETLKTIKSIDTTEKNNKYIILKSGSWIKGTEDCIRYAKENNLEYELVFNLPHQDLLKKLAKSKGLILLPRGLDTCPRLTMEAKMLGCDLIMNDFVQHKDEEWFKKGQIEENILKGKRLFFEKCLNFRHTNKKNDENIKFHFIIPSYNASKWIWKTIKSIKNQTNSSFTATIIDDMSTDQTLEVVKKHTNHDKRFRIIKNKKKKYALKNIKDALDSLDPDIEDVIIVLDGDDWLSSFDVLNYLTQIYNEEGVWLTYGSYETSPTGERGVEPSPYPLEIINNNRFREDKWRASHLRTFKYRLWKEIDKADFIDDDGEYYKMSYDQAMMLPMLEMAPNKIRYVEEVLHIYNRGNPLNVDRIKQKEQYETMLRIRKKKPHKRINFEN